MFVAGKSGNLKGRPKHSATSIKGRVERFLRRQMTATRLNRIFDELDAKDQVAMLKEFLPYVMPKQSSEGISQEEIDRLARMLENAIDAKQKAV